MENIRVYERSDARFISRSRRNFEDFQKGQFQILRIKKIMQIFKFKNSFQLLTEKSWKRRIRECQIVDSYVTFEETFFNWFLTRARLWINFSLIVCKYYKIRESMVKKKKLKNEFNYQRE